MQSTHEVMRGLPSPAGSPAGARRRRLLLMLAASAVANWVQRARAAERAANLIRVAAASDLQFALRELAQAYEAKSGRRVQITLGSSGSLAQQIRQGLPADLFLSADEQFVFQLADAGRTQDRGQVYALGRIALLVPAASPIELDPRLRGLRAALPALRHFAIANPEHAPYGRAARQALERLGLWAPLQAKLVIGENVAQATQFVTGGAAEAGMTAASLAQSPPVAQLGRSLVLPAEWHAPLRQRMVLMRTATSAARQFYEFLQSPDARAQLLRHGFGAV